MTQSIHSGFIAKLEALQKTAQRKISDVYCDHLHIEPWTLPIGYGLTGVCQGKNLEKAAVSISVVKSAKLPAAATNLRPYLSGCPYEVAGLSIIFHPHNPHLPTAHANIRCFEVSRDCGDIVRWYGGGVDITPYLPIEEESYGWHRALQAYINDFDSSQELYPLWKENCDRYFYLKNRQEPRGIGGVFFDDYEGAGDYQKTEDFLVGMIELFLDWNFRQAERYLKKAYSQEEKDFQHWRRGRYVEFNLLYDRGTLFGLQAGGRVESILLSLPPVVNWIYDGESVFSKNNKLLIDHLETIAAREKKLQKL